MKPTNRSLSRAIELLNVLTSGSQNLSQLSDAIGIMPSGTLKVVRTFMEARIVEHGADGRYRLSAGVCRFARAYIEQNPLSKVALPEVKRLSGGSGVHVVLAILRNHQQVNLLYVDEVMGFAETMPSGIGAAWMQATGQVLLAYAGEEALMAHLRKYPLIEGRLKIHTVSELMVELEAIRERGYAVVELPYMGTCATAAPIRDFTGEVIGSLGQPLPVGEKHGPRIEAVVEAAVRISTLAGFADYTQWVR